MAFETEQYRQWLAARLDLLAREKQLTHLRDELAAERRALPRVPVQDYRFESQEGPTALSTLFDGSGQLIVYHFMLGPDWEQPCKSCSFWAEHFDGIRVHLRHRDANLVAVSRAPIEKIAAVRERMGWRFPWVSSLDSSFNYDFGVSFTEEQQGQPLYNFGTIKAGSGELPGVSVFARDGDALFHTYSAYARGLDALNGTYQWLDLLPRGRDEAGLSYPMEWVRLKDSYA